MRRVYIVRSLHCSIFCVSLSLLFPQISTFINTHAFSLSLITITALFLGIVCQFALDDAIIWLLHLHLFPLISLYAHTSVHCPVSPQFHSTCYSAVHESLSLSLSPPPLPPWLLNLLKAASNFTYQLVSSSSISTTTLSWVSACSTVVKHSQQEGFTECR
jgi:hypothetical protein